MNKNLLPPIIVDYIEKLSDNSLNQFQKDNYCMILERVRAECDVAITKFKGTTSNKRKG